MDSIKNFFPLTKTYLNLKIAILYKFIRLFFLNLRHLLGRILYQKQVINFVKYAVYPFLKHFFNSTAEFRFLGKAIF